MGLPLTRLGLAVVCVLAFVFLSRVGGRERWRSWTDDRFVSGIPWATILTAALLVAFYLLAQGGWAHPTEPLTLPFRSWSWFYPVGLVTSGFAHGSPGHLVGNVTGLVVFGSIVEYAVGHYGSTNPGAEANAEGVERPGHRIALLTLGMLALAIVPSPVSFGWSLGYSGAVYALAAIAVVVRPLAAVVGIVASSSLGVLVDAFRQPIVHATRTAGPPSLPDWASIAFQSHLLGFLLGALLGVWLLRRRDRAPDPTALFGALVLFGLAKSVWLLSWPAAEGQSLYRGAGVAFVALLAVAITVEASDVELSSTLRRSTLPSLPVSTPSFPGSVPSMPSLPIPLPKFLSHPDSRPSLSSIGNRLGWIVFWASITFVLVLVVDATTALAVVAAIVIGAVILDRLDIGVRVRLDAVLSSRLPSVSTPEFGPGGRVLVALLVGFAAFGAVFGPVTISTASLDGTGAVTVEDYTITYAENVTEGRTFTLFGTENETDGEPSASGVLVASERRAIWSTAVRPDELSHDGVATVRVGGIGWERTVTANRSAWDVVGNESASVVDLTVAGETTRSFTSDPVRADVRIDGHAIAVVPTADGFDVRVTRNGSTLGADGIPMGNGTVSIGPIRISTGEDDASLVAAADGTRATVARKEGGR